MHSKTPKESLPEITIGSLVSFLSLGESVAHKDLLLGH